MSVETQTTLEPRQGPLPAEMRLLLEQYPREAWLDHPNFAQATQNWLGAHQMFRRLSRYTREITEAYLDRDLSSAAYSDRLAHYGGALVRNLNGHHHWEDHSYVPELSAADPRFNRGLEILEKDHQVLDGILVRFSAQATRALRLLQLDERQAFDEVGAVHGLSGGIEDLLDRHLVDEEELAVPIILHHKLRG